MEFTPNPSSIFQNKKIKYNNKKPTKNGIIWINFSKIRKARCTLTPLSLRSARLTQFDHILLRFTTQNIAYTETLAEINKFFSSADEKLFGQNYFMNPEKSQNIEQPESQIEGSINLDTLSFSFCENDLVRNFYDEKLRELEDKTKWLQENKEKLERNKDKIAKAVEDGLIADAEPKTIWQFQVDKAKKGQERVVAIKSELESHVDEIKNEVAKRLGKFLPDWSPDQTKIVFTINEKADFCIDRDTITVDLGRLLFEQDSTEKVNEGVAHEVFHRWMSEESEWSDSEQDEVSDQALKESVIFKTVDEGLAVLISGQSLEEHHIKQGRDFAGYTKESFESFNNFLSENDRERLEKIKNEEFQNMGHFYVVGNEVVKIVLQHEGIEKFKKLIIDARNNPSVFLQRYSEICDEDNKLPKINS